MNGALYLIDPASILDADLEADLDGVLPDLSLYNGVRVWERDVAGAENAERLLRVMVSEYVTWRWLGSTDELVGYIRALRDTLLYPLCDLFRGALADCLALAEQEALRRLRGLTMRERGSDRFVPWETADLVAEVEAVCGPGVRRGRSVVFRCCFHEDRNPSLAVDPVKRVWYCHPCARGGGVVDFRKAIAGVAA